MSDLFPTEIRTECLRLLGPASAVVDLETLYEHCRDGAPTVDEETRYLPWNPYPTPKAGHDYLDRVTELWEEGTGARYVAVPRAGEEGAGEFAGTTGIGVDWDRRRGVFGMWLRKPFWGRGYSGERADAMLELAFAHLDLDAVEVAHLPANEQSRRAIEKYVGRNGGETTGRFRNVDDDDGTVHDVRQYAVTAAEWRAATGDGTGNPTFVFDDEPPSLPLVGVADGGIVAPDDEAFVDG